ncbi:hypothetical protein IW262DRAFT_1465116 [Armillaria fumosa]|nr:hypothetical protein IW262DRAFT_1465116 [Armillaria fumosa]
MPHWLLSAYVVHVNELDAIKNEIAALTNVINDDSILAEAIKNDLTTGLNAVVRQFKDLSLHGKIRESFCFWFRKATAKVPDGVAMLSAVQGNIGRTRASYQAGSFYTTVFQKRIDVYPLQSTSTAAIQAAAGSQQQAQRAEPLYDVVKGRASTQTCRLPREAQWSLIIPATDSELLPAFNIFWLPFIAYATSVSQGQAPGVSAAATHPVVKDTTPTALVRRTVTSHMTSSSRL